MHQPQHPSTEECSSNMLAVAPCLARKNRSTSHPQALPEAAAVLGFDQAANNPTHQYQTCPADKCQQEPPPNVIIIKITFRGSSKSIQHKGKPPSGGFRYGPAQPPYTTKQAYTTYIIGGVESAVHSRPERHGSRYQLVPVLVP
jgi:hypothetical protein